MEYYFDNAATTPVRPEVDRKYYHILQKAMVIHQVFIKLHRKTKLL